VCARHGALATVGEPGEILIRTPYLSRGYLNDPELTARRFTPNPFTADPADTVYRTGDIGRYRPDGAVEYVGRRDFQIKVRGVRVELQEVEQLLLQHPAIADAALVCHGDDDDRQLVAFVVPATAGVTPEPGALRRFLGGAVVDAAIPARFEWIPRMPMTANSKLDRAALAAAASAPLERRSGAPARSATEREISGIWADVLKCHEIGIDESFFDRGGHSLLAMQVVSRVRARFGVDLPLRTLFESPTIAAMASEVDRQAATAAADGTCRDEFEF
jgi:hypothetical protein